MGLSSIFLVCAIAGGGVLILRLILLFAGVDHTDSPDASIDLGHDGLVDSSISSGVNLLSVQSIAGFFTIFGLAGLGLIQAKVLPVLSLLGALLAGALTAWATAMIFFQMQRLRSEGTMNINDAIGQVGRVYLTIHDDETGVVSVIVRGTLRNLEAISVDGSTITTGTMVKVESVSDGKTLVVSKQNSKN